MSMAICNIKIILLITYLLLCYKEVEGRKRLSRTKDKLLNKPVTKSIRTKYGDIYDCIDFDKQPAFDHPLLKNHTYNYQVRPSSYPKGRSNNETPTRKSKTLDIWSNVKGCPVGTVPIRKIIKDDLIRAKKVSKPSSFTPTISGHIHAVIRTTNPNRKYNGVGANIALYNPHLGHTDQYSSGRIKIQNGGDSIQVGWTVNPTLYGDNRTRMFTYLSAGQSHCFNTQCPGFIIVNHHIPLDFVFDTISDQVTQFDWKFFVYRDSSTGDWWLNFGEDDTQVGFWPKRIFTGGLGNLASYIDWGGEVYSPPNHDHQPAPYMGSGHPPYDDSTYDAFCRHTTFVNEAHEIVPATDTEPYVDTIHFYGVSDWWDEDSYWGHIVVFGGGLWRLN